MDLCIYTENLMKYKDKLSSSKYADSNSIPEAILKLLQLAENSEGKKIVLGFNQENGTHTNSNCQTAGDLIENFDDMCTINETDKFTYQISKLALSHSMFLNQMADQDILYGEREWTMPRFRRKQLPFFDLSRRYINAMIDNDVDSLDLIDDLNQLTYASKFHQLLWLEEAHQSSEMRRYDKENTILSKDQNYLVMQVEGLAEGRPSLIKGDEVILHNTMHGNRKLQGFIHKIKEDKISIRFNDDFHYEEGTSYNVFFRSQRTSFVKSHRALMEYKRESEFSRRLVFPGPDTLASSRKPYLDCQDNFLFPQLNTIQRQAVRNMLKNVCRPTPYILFGPPGTGKTVTLVETILQVYRLKPGSRILACGNSNASADVLAEKLKKSKGVNLDELIRLTAQHRLDRDDMIPAAIEDITKAFDFQDEHFLEPYRIFVTTCITASNFNDFDDKMFDFVFIDESGHAQEPEALVALSLVKENGCTVLAGDPYQLGPVVMSQLAKDKGLGLSILERLYKRLVADSDEINPTFDERFITKLCISYRSDERVMQVNNKFFYHNQLTFQDSTPEKLLKGMNLKYPLVFHAIQGKERKEKSNPSWFNPSELTTCLAYLKKLYNLNYTKDDIGFITPYRQQLNKMKILIEAAKLPLCKVGTVEEFQGLERKVILISTVRTFKKKKYVEIDKKFKLGFLAEEKRFNVAVSRAKWLVIVVGDVRILEEDERWLAYIKVCENNKSLIGQTST